MLNRLAATKCAKNSGHYHDTNTSTVTSSKKTLYFVHNKLFGAYLGLCRRHLKQRY